MLKSHSGDVDAGSDFARKPLTLRLKHKRIPATYQSRTALGEGDQSAPQRKVYLICLILVVLTSACGGSGTSSIGSGGGGSGGSGGNGGGSQISIQRVQPSRAMVGVPVGSLTLSGANFTANSAVLFDGLAIPTFFDNPTLEAEIPNSAWNTAQSHTVQVSDPANGKSNVATYDVYAPRAGPQPFIGQPTQYIGESLIANSLVPDLNGDGRADLIVVAQDPNTMQNAPEVRLGQTDGTFSAPVALGSFTLSFSPVGVLPGDFNGDGFTDLILFGPSLNSSAAYQVLLNDGSGNFSSAGSGMAPATNGSPPVLVGDFNHDGKLDFMCGGAPSGQPFSVYYGNGDGTFSAPVPAGTAMGGVAGFAMAADLNGDGYTDVVFFESFYNQSPIQVRMLLSGPGGTYTDRPVTGLPSPTLGFVVADFNNDHIPDIFAIGLNDLGATYVGAGDGTFSLSGNPVLATDGYLATLPFVVGDFDNDGNMDIATRTSTFGPDELNFLWGDGKGNFTRQAVACDHSFTLQVGDVNGDGIPDIFEGADPGFGYQSVTLGSRTRSSASAQIIIPRFPGYLSAGDVFGDGFSDLLIGGVDNGSGGPGLPGAIYHAQPNGSFAIQANSPGYNTVLVDLNGDGIPDMVGFAGTDMFVWQGDRTGNFQLANQISLPNGFAQFAFRDMDGDGHMDIILPGQILYGSGNFQFIAVSVPQTSQGFAVGDFDGDGIPDLATSSGILFGLGNRNFTGPTASVPLLSNGPFSTQSVADMNGDGKDDLVLANGGFVEVYLSTGRQGFVLDQSLIVNGYAPTVTSVTAGDFNGDGLADIAVGMLGADDLVLFTNDGTGKYQVTTYAIGINAVNAITADFNHDGKPDIAFLNFNYSFTLPTVTVLLHK